MAEKRGVVCPHCDATNAVPTDREPLVARCGRCHQKLFEGVPAALDAARARKHIRNSDLPVIVDFWASWCGPCRTMAPIFEQAARSIEPKARFIKVDVDANPDIASEYGVQGIPALLAFKNGNVVARQAGVTDLGTLRGWPSGSVLEYRHRSLIGASGVAMLAAGASNAGRPHVTSLSVPRRRLANPG